MEMIMSNNPAAGAAGRGVGSYGTPARSAFLGTLAAPARWPPPGARREHLVQLVEQGAQRSAFDLPALPLAHSLSGVSERPATSQDPPCRAVPRVDSALISLAGRWI